MMSAGYAGRELENLESAVCERIKEVVDRIDTYWATNPSEKHEDSGHRKNHTSLSRRRHYTIVLW